MKFQEHIFDAYKQIFPPVMKGAAVGFILGFLLNFINGSQWSYVDQVIRMFQMIVCFALAPLVIGLISWCLEPFIPDRRKFDPFRKHR